MMEKRGSRRSKNDYIVKKGAKAEMLQKNYRINLVNKYQSVI